MKIFNIVLIISLFSLCLNISWRQVVACARNQLGKRYISGGTNPKVGFDCSVLAYFYDLSFNIKSSE